MFTRRSLFNQAALLAILLVCGCEAAKAQGFARKGQDLPDASRFYMARQQWQVVNDSPVVSGQPGGPAGQQQQQAAPPPAPAPAPLPRSGFQSYTPAAPQLSTSLPKVNNGVPPKLPPQGAPSVKKPPAGAKGKAGKLPPSKPSSSPNGPKVQAYAPYKGFSADPSASVPGPSMNSQSKVQGSVLHWARARHGAGTSY